MAKMGAKLTGNAMRATKHQLTVFLLCLSYSFTKQLAIRSNEDLFSVTRRWSGFSPC